MSSKRWITTSVFGALTAVCLWAFFHDDETPVDDRYTGAYQMSDGSILTIMPSTPERLRLRHMDGRVRALYYTETGMFEVADGFSSRGVIGSAEFRYEDGVAADATLKLDGEQSQIRRLALRREDMEFQSGDIRLRGRLTLPHGDGPFPVVIMVHGSEDYSAVDYYHLPYLLAAQGIAGFAFDKRGTGASDGDYTQHFPTLANDVVAAARLLSTQPTIDPERINLAGFSQGGWVAPLAAEQTDIHSILVGFGCAVSVRREDRWGYIKQLHDHGFGDDEIALADSMNAQLDAIIDNGSDAAWDRLFALLDQHMDDAWFRAIVGSDSLLGIVTEKASADSAAYVPEFAWKLYFRWRRGDGPDFNRTYEPATTLRSMDTPSLWLLAGEDSSAPTEETTAVLDELRAFGKPIKYQVYATAEHGNIVYVEDEAGERIYTGYAPTYFDDIVAWFQEQNAL